MATVIRNGELRSRPNDPSVRPASFTLSDMAPQGDAYVRDVQARATELVAAARAEADQVRAKAEADGRRAAEAEFEKRLDQRLGSELATLGPALKQVAGAVEAARGEWADHWRSSAVGLAVAIAERIVRRELAADPTISEQWLRESLELAAGSSSITVRLAPTDHERLGHHGEAVAAQLGAAGVARFVADDAIEPGGCRVETTHGAIDNQLTTQLERLAEELG